MYKKNKKAFFILIVGIIASLFITLSPNTEDDLEIRVDVQTDSSVPFFNFSNTKTNSINNINQPIQPPDRGEDNLIEGLVQLYKEGLASGSQPEDFINILKDSSLGNPDVLFNAAYFTENDLLISSDNSVENQRNYIQNIRAVTLNNFKDLNNDFVTIIDDWMKQDNAGLTQYVEIIPRQIDGMLRVEAPPSWQAFHLKSLNLWHRQLLVYGALLDNQYPLKAFIAFQTVPDLIKEVVYLQTGASERALVLENRNE